MLAAATAAGAPSSLADATGAIAGTVTEAAAPHGPIAGIQVCAYNRSESAGPEEPAEPPCATTGAGGEYTIAGLPSGQYSVEFWAPPASHLNYVPQYYDDKTGEKTADAVTVGAPATTTGIDAQLAVGGQIAGTVADANSGAGIEGALVCAGMVEGEIGGCAVSGAGGAYTVPGLATGSYRVFFFHPKYRVQYYDGKTNPTEATPVAVVQEATTAGIDAALRPASSTVAQPPVSPGPLGPGGVAEGGGKASPTGPVPNATVLSRRLVVKRHSVYVKIRCLHARCVGRVGLLQRTDQGRLHLVKRFAFGSFSIAPGHRRTVAMRLMGSKVLPMFANARRHPIALELELTVRGGNSARERVSIG